MSSAGLGEPVVVSFRLGAFRFGGVFASGWIDDAFIPFVNMAIAHHRQPAKGCFFAVLPTGEAPTSGAPGKASADIATLYVAYVSESAFEAAEHLGILPGEREGYVPGFPRDSLPPNSVVEERPKARSRKRATKLPARPSEPDEPDADREWRNFMKVVPVKGFVALASVEPRLEGSYPFWSKAKIRSVFEGLLKEGELLVSEDGEQIARNNAENRS